MGSLFGIGRDTKLEGAGRGSGVDWWLCVSLLQWGVLPGDNHWHGSHNEHVHSRAVWRGRHGKWGKPSPETAPAGVTPSQILHSCVLDHTVSPNCPIFHLSVVYIPFQIACK